MAYARAPRAPRAARAVRSVNQLPPGVHACAVRGESTFWWSQQQSRHRRPQNAWPRSRAKTRSLEKEKQTLNDEGHHQHHWGAALHFGAPLYAFKSTVCTPILAGRLRTAPAPWETCHVLSHLNLSHGKRQELQACFGFLFSSSVSDKWENDRENDRAPGCRNACKARGLACSL